MIDTGREVAMIVYGVNPVLEALRAGRARVVRVSERGGRRTPEIVSLAEASGVRVVRVAPEWLDREARGGVHQGVAADVEPAVAPELDEVLSREGQPRLMVVLDGVEDPQNFGAILRSADAAGVDAVVRQSRRSAKFGAAAARASAGAVAHVPVVTVVNIARALESIRAAGVWTVGLDAEAKLAYDEVDLTLPTAVVLGAEGKGLRRLVSERCDVLASIPMHGHVDSLNVAVAGGIVLFEARRQRRAAAGAGLGGSLGGSA